MIRSDRSGVSLNAQQWQTLECVIEYENTSANMAFFAKQLGLPKSTFSKNVKLLVAQGLVERYQQINNRKNIVLKPSEKGRALYLKDSAIILNSGWKEAFSVLEDLPDENLALIVKFMEKLAADLEPENNKVFELMKLP
ncbi:MAG: MarR family transcriptional regulator [Treponemataceae bacterium]